MFTPAIHRERRNRLKKDVGSGLILFLGNDEVGMNYTANRYDFRQDSTFLYFWALDHPGLAAIIDVDQDIEMAFGNDLTLADIVWTGPQPTMAARAAEAGIASSAPLAELASRVSTAIQQGRRVHFLPPYRAEHQVKLSDLLGIAPGMVRAYRSEPLVKAVVDQRSIKGHEEIVEIEGMVNVAREMHVAAMVAAAPGRYEQEVVAEMMRVVKAHGCTFSFPPIFSVHGETLHNPYHRNLMRAGDIAVCDAGVESPRHYASDITRTIPINGTFNPQQRDLYDIVLRATRAGIEAVEPGVAFRDVYMLAARSLMTDLKSLGLVKGDVAEAVEAGAHAMFFQCGLGHMLGMDVHDMENLGEEFVGYEPGVTRSPQFGLCYLRLARKLQPGFVLTVEPGLYFIPAQIDQWKAERHFEPFLDFEAIEKFRDARGYRIEENVLVTETGCRVLGEPIPATVEEVERACAG